MRLYLDESGHTGKHLFDEAQPLLVYAGVWLDAEAEDALTKEFAAQRARHGMPDGELKGNKLMSSVRGRRFLGDCLRPCSSARSPVSVVLFNKPFMAAAVVVEDCTDHVYNSAFDARWTWDTRLKVPLAKKLYEVSDPNILMLVWKARTGPKENFVETYKRLLFALQVNPDKLVADIAEKMSEANFGEIWESAQVVDQSQWSYSPNFNAFVAMIQGAEEQAAVRALASVELVHDEQLQYQKSLWDVFGTFTKAARGEFPLPNGNVMKLPLDRLVSLSFARSESTTGLQVADLVASLTRTIATGVALEKETIGDARRWLMEGGDGVFPYFVGPSDWQKRVFAHFAGAAG